MNGEIIKEFLVGLGFEVDKSSFASFNSAIISATKRVTAMYAAVKVATAGIAYGIARISDGFEEMGYQMRLVVPTINKVIMLRREMLRAYSAAGINLTKVVQQSILFNFSLTKTRYALEAIYKGVASRFFPLLTRQSDIFRQKLYANMPKIIAGIERFVFFVFKAFDATVQLGSRLWSVLNRVYDFFVMLDKATDGWSTKILAALAAWRLLNLGFLATPLGMLISGFVALLALWDDFKTFQEGGQSLIDWGSTTTKVFLGVAASIVAITTAIYAARTAMVAYRAVATAVTAIQAAFNIAMAANPIGLIIAGVGLLIASLLVLYRRWEDIKASMSSFFGGIGGSIMNFLGAPNVADNVKNGMGGAPTTPQAVGSQIQNSMTNQKVSQETNIVVQGTADANRTAQAVSSEQSRVNFDLVRNLKGATR